MEVTQKFTMFSETIFFHPMEEFDGVDKSYCNYKHIFQNNIIYAILIVIETKNYINTEL